MPSIAEKNLMKKKYNKILSNSFQKTKSTQTGGSVFADRIEQVKKTNFEFCFLVVHGNYTSNSVYFQIRFL